MRDPRAAYDALRDGCPIAYSEFLGWSLFRHADVARVLHDHETFSNAVSGHMSVPNGMDPPEHTPYRKIIEPYFAPERMAAFEPTCRSIASGLASDLAKRRDVEFVSEVATPFAAQAQCAFLNWPADWHRRLADWTRKNQAATRERDREAMSHIAIEFETLVDELINARSGGAGSPAHDLTDSLMREKVWGRPLSNEEIASILRNWTVGEIGTISAAVGILVEFLASHDDLQRALRAQPDKIPAAAEEILRIHGPLVTNRRLVTCPVTIRGKRLAAGERVTVNWVSANRDAAAFDAPNEFRIDRPQDKNLLYGAGIHYCPGASLARLEMRVFLEEMLAQTHAIEMQPGTAPEFAKYPASGFDSLHLQIAPNPNQST